jgi:hypothetical protein
LAVFAELERALLGGIGKERFEIGQKLQKKGGFLRAGFTT